MTPPPPSTGADVLRISSPAATIALPDTSQAPGGDSHDVSSHGTKPGSRDIGSGSERANGLSPTVGFRILRGAMR
ncbi:hypothetical protein AvCA_09870 [Azotobacter vinelandii CA]|uniref:Uncharacterized protein n=2 Tax=Azotobacter vinelandii TaxID=354 RepID=C1DNK3_AZOVD|nr:hypothetical protein Avin_09870 [Azotobacter vinelandii DJ]AGK17135.1 hypothetical protein AvCA_09870 [Azotobacter vinelandii CA]AGK19647.1 hypothetical protein AvCA6_09870 [Azotobacter vinelandii CA6]